MIRPSTLSLLLVAGAMACGSDSKPAGDAGRRGGEGGAAQDVLPGSGDGATAPDGAVGNEVGDTGRATAVDAHLGPGCPVPPAERPAGVAPWNTLDGFKSAATFYSSPGGIWVAENLLYYQNGDGGWPKDIEMADRSAPRNARSMIDNSATTAQLEYMAYMLGAFPDCQRYRDSFTKGLEWIFAAQYQANGGWPQAWPNPTGYAAHITYNDNAMVHVLELLLDMMNGTAPFGFVDQATRTRSAAALAKGVDCILATQIEVSGKKTGWCAQHHEVTLEPANARAYELASISGSEGAAVLAFLMTLDLARPEMPKQGIIDAVEGAAVFYGSEPIKIVGLQKSNQDTDAGANDLVMVEVPGAGPLWARFYELDPPHRPFFCDRDGVKKYDVAEIGYERRNGYAWYGNWPVGPVRDTYPKWAARWTPGRNVMAPQGMVDAGVDASEPPR